MSASNTYLPTSLDDLPGYTLVTDAKGSLLHANALARTDFAIELASNTSTPLAFKQLFPYQEEDWSCLLQGKDSELVLEEILRGGQGQEIRVLLRGKKQTSEVWFWLVSDLTSVKTTGKA